MGAHEQKKIGMCTCSSFGNDEPPCQISKVKNRSVHASLMTHTHVWERTCSWRHEHFLCVPIQGRVHVFVFKKIVNSFAYFTNDPQAHKPPKTTSKEAKTKPRKPKGSVQAAYNETNVIGVRQMEEPLHFFCLFYLFLLFFK